MDIVIVAILMNIIVQDSLEESEYDTIQEEESNQNIEFIRKQILFI